MIAIWYLNIPLVSLKTVLFEFLLKVLGMVKESQLGLITNCRVIWKWGEMKRSKNGSQWSERAFFRGVGLYRRRRTRRPVEFSTQWTYMHNRTFVLASPFILNITIYTVWNSFGILIYKKINIVELIIGFYYKWSWGDNETGVQSVLTL